MNYRLGCGPERRLEAIAPADLTACLEQAQTRAETGRVADHIERLAEADPTWCALQIAIDQGPLFAAGAPDLSFTLMSAVKPFLLLYGLHQWGSGAVAGWVGQEPSALPFNSLDQLEADGGWPRNPMINSGAIALAGQLPGRSGAECCQTVCDWLNRTAGCALELDQAMLASVYEAGEARNRAIAQLLHEAGSLPQPEIALDAYSRLCCLAGRVEDLARLGLLLASPQGAIAPTHQHQVNQVMLTCGLYEASSAAAATIGLPMKSGISGALVAIVPGQGAIACYSPGLDQAGNPVVGLALVEAIARALRREGL